MEFNQIELDYIFSFKTAWGRKKAIDKIVEIKSKLKKKSKQ